MYALPAAGVVPPSAFAQSSSLAQDNTADQDAANLGTQDQDEVQEQDTEQDATQEDLDVQVGESVQQQSQQPVEERDTTPPTVTVPEDIVLEPTSAEGTVVRYTVTAQDNVDGTATLDENNRPLQDDDVRGDIDISCDPPSGSEFPVGETVVECTATDAAGNTGTASFMITVAFTCEGEIATIVGTPGDDRGDNAIVGTDGDDVIAALSGNDEVRGLGGDDRICGDEGIDTMNGDAGNDSMDGGDGNDVMAGGGDNDIMFGSDGSDRMDGGDGDDNLNSEDGVVNNDSLDGFEGTDTCLSDPDPELRCELD